MRPDIFGEHVFVWLGPWPLTGTMVTSTATSLLVLALWVAAARAVRRAPDGRLAAAGRLGIGFFRDLVGDAVGRASANLEVFAASFFSFIAAGAILGQLPGVASPTSNLAAASALAAVVFVAVPVAGIHARGPRAYLRHYLRPNPLLFPLHVISELSRTLALALRLFGNMMSGHLVVALLVALAGLFLPVPLMALDLLIGLLQAYIFTILACVYIGAAIRVGKGETS